MKRSRGSISLACLLIIILGAACKDTAMDSSLYTVENINGARFVHNHAPQLGETSRVKLELLGKIGELDGKEEKDILYEPVDAARLPNGDIFILERGGCTVKRYDKNYGYKSSFGHRGQGPGDFLSPYCLRLTDNKLYVADSKISIFSLDGSYEDGFKPAAITGGSIGAQYKTSGMAVLPGSHVILPSPPSLWVESGEQKLLSIYDKKGTMIRSFGAVQRYDNPQLTLNANIVSFAVDDNDNVYIAYTYQNRISKFKSEGQMVFSADRPLPYELINETKKEVFTSGDDEMVFEWPSVTSVTKGISIDSRNRIWALTFLKQPNRFLTFDENENWSDCFEFDVFDDNGVLLFKVPFPNVRFDNFSLYEDRIYLTDFQNESCVYEYAIIEKN